MCCVQEKCHQYWPNSGCSLRLGWLIIEAQSEYAMRDYTLRELRVTDTINAESRTIRQFQLLEWPVQFTQSGAPVLDAFLDFLSQVRRPLPHILGKSIQAVCTNSTFVQTIHYDT